MLLFRSPAIIFAFLISLSSIILTISTISIAYNHPHPQIQLLILFPPLNTILLLLFSVIWIERRFRLSYVPFICLTILLISSITLTIISYLSLSSSIILYLNLTFYLFLTVVYFLVILIIIISYSNVLLNNYRHHRMTSVEQHNKELSNIDESQQFDKFILKSRSNDFLISISKLSNKHANYDVNMLIDNLTQINVDTILTLNATSKLSNINTTTDKQSTIDLYSVHIKQTNIEHIVYHVYDSCIPKSISEHIQFLFGMMKNLTQMNHNHLFVHCTGGIQMIGMTLVCIKLLYDFSMNDSGETSEQNFCERLCHYPLLLKNHCRVCQAISSVRQIQSRSIYNPLQIIYVHEFYARLKSVSYMEQIKNIVNHLEKYITNNIDDINAPISF